MIAMIDGATNRAAEPEKRKGDSCLKGVWDMILLVALNFFSTSVSMNVKMSDRAKKFPQWAVKEAIEKSKERQKSDGSPCFISCYHWACNQGVILANLEMGRIEIRQPFDLRIVVLVEEGVGVGVSDWDDFDIPNTATAESANRLIHRKLKLPFQAVR